MEGKILDFYSLASLRLAWIKMSYRMLNYFTDKENDRILSKIKFILYSIVPIVIFILFYIFVISKYFYPFELSWKENKELLRYNNEVLVYQWKRQNLKETRFYNDRYRRVLDSTEIRNGYFTPDSVKMRNLERERDIKIIKIGLKLYARKHSYKFPITPSPQKIEQHSEIYKALQSVLYNVPVDPNPSLFTENSYFYQSLDGNSYKITVFFEELNAYGQVYSSEKTFTYP